MKRSKMIKLIELYVDNNVAISILEEIEEAGMLPPNNGNESFCGSDFLNDCKWDEE